MYRICVRGTVFGADLKVYILGRPQMLDHIVK